MQPASSLELARAILAREAESLAGQGRALPADEAVRTLLEIEHISRIVDHLQVLGAGIAKDLGLGSVDQPRGGASLTAPPKGSPGEPAVSSAVGNPHATTVAVNHDSTLAGAGGERKCTQYLRATLGISHTEAKRRLLLAHHLLPSISPSGAALAPSLEVLAGSVRSGSVSGRAATVICAALDRVRCIASPDELQSMEHHLTRQATESDEDVLRIVARRWETVLDQDGQEPTEKVLRARQGVFLKGRRQGLNFLEIGATDDQFEFISTVLNTATNPRAHGAEGAAGHRPPNRQSGDHSNFADVSADTGTGWHPQTSTAIPSGESARPTRAQSMLNGLVGACRIVLAGKELPATGGHRPQVMVTIDYQDLLRDLTSNADRDYETTRNHDGQLTGDRRASGGSGSRMSSRDEAAATPGDGRGVFAEHISARTIRQIACDAELIPVVLGGEGQVLDLGRAGRLFPPHLRRALIARDSGCAFPDCTIPATWCGAHHIVHWSHGGSTSLDNGVLLCSHHHHTIHQEAWTVVTHEGVPWFSPPPHLQHRGVTARRNRYWTVRPGTS